MIGSIAGAVALGDRPLEGLVPALSRPRLPGWEDEGRVWADGRAGLAHAVPVGSPAGPGDERQPIVDPVSGCAIVLDGRIDNRDELGRAVRPRGVRGGPAGDAALVLGAYLEWGDAFVSRLLGDFALAVWNPDRRELLLARDPLGLRPLHYAVRDDVLLFASTVPQLFEGGSVPRDVSDEAAISYLYLVPLETKSFYRHVHPLPGGHLLESLNGSVHVRAYQRWPDEPPDQRVASGDEPEEFRALFTEAVRCRLAGAGTVGLPLSGGLDSGSVASVAGLLGRVEGSQIPRAYSWTFDRFRACDERQYAVAAASAYDLPHTLVPGDELWSLRGLDRWLPLLTDPVFSLYDGAFFELLDGARSDGVRTMITTVGGDELLSGFPEYLADWLLLGHWRRVWREVRGGVRAGVYAGPIHRELRMLVSALVTPLLPPAIASLPGGGRVGRSLRAPMPPVLARAYGRDAMRLPVSGRTSWWQFLRRALTAPGRSNFYGYWDRMLRLHGMETSYPFLDVRLIQFGLRTAPDAFYRAGSTKMAVREGLRDVLPPIIRDRVDKPGLGQLADHSLRGPHAPFVRRLLVDSELVRREYVLPAPWRANVERYLAGDGSLRTVCWLGVSLELWLRHLVGRLEPILPPPPSQKPSIGKSL